MLNSDGKWCLASTTTCAILPAAARTTQQAFCSVCGVPDSRWPSDIVECPYKLTKSSQRSEAKRILALLWANFLFGIVYVNIPEELIYFINLADYYLFTEEAPRPFSYQCSMMCATQWWRKCREVRPANWAESCLGGCRWWPKCLTL